MEVLPRELLTTIYRELGKIDYLSFACTSRNILAIANETLATLTLAGNTLTASYCGYHLSEYQTSVIRSLLLGENKYNCIPDYENLTIIPLIYAHILSQVKTVVVCYDHTLLIDSDPKFAKMFEGTTTGKLSFSHKYPVVQNVDHIIHICSRDTFISDGEHETIFRLMDLSRESFCTHPSYITEQRSKVIIGKGGWSIKLKRATIVRVRRGFAEPARDYINKYDVFIIEITTRDHMRQVHAFYTALARGYKGKTILIDTQLFEVKSCVVENYLTFPKFL